MALSINSPKVVTHRETDGTWTATLYIEGLWHAQMKGYATAAEARKAIRKRYLGA